MAQRICKSGIGAWPIQQRGKMANGRMDGMEVMSFYELVQWQAILYGVGGRCGRIGCFLSFHPHFSGGSWRK